MAEGGLPDLSGIDLSGVMSKLSENPELLKTAMNLFSGAGKSGGTSDVPAADSKPEEAAPAAPAMGSIDAISSLLPLFASPKGGPGGKPHCDKNIALLLALKPYLSGSRCEMIDKIVKFNKLGGLMRMNNHQDKD